MSSAPAFPGALAVLAVPQGTERKTAGLVKVGVVGGLVLAAACVPLLVFALLTGSATYAIACAVGVLCWLLVAAGSAAWGRRVRGTPQTSGGTVLGAVLPDSVYVGGGLTLPMTSVAEVGLFWFSIPVRGRNVPGVGRALGTAMIDATNEAAGGNLGLAAVVRPHDPAVLSAPPAPGTVPVEIRTDPAGQPVAVVKAFRLVVDGDPVVFGRALADVADRHGVLVGGPRLPPPNPPELDGWLV